jgi:hypothetical protein|tara:strand:- start:8116 stop:8367 length:252 start_codon:yes stop_codon:yes gene_type:complete
MDKEEMMIVYSAIQGLESREESLLLGTLVDSAKQILEIYMSGDYHTQMAYNDGPIKIKSVNANLADDEMKHALLVAKALEEEE